MRRMIARARATGTKKLDLSEKGRRRLPPALGQLSNLEDLYLHFNQLTELPPELGQLSNLKVLALHVNQLTELPPELGQLSNLEDLYLHVNQLTELPPELGQLSNLKVLTLHFNQLTELPPELGQLSNLKILHLNNNQLRELPPELGQLSNLEYLYLHGGHLTKLAPELGNLSNLEVLDLHNNQLRELPGELGQLSNLESLYLHNNQLTELPVELGHLTKLKELYLDKERIKSPPPEIVQQGTAATLFYLQELLAGSSRQWVSKLLVVGEGGVGKTSLLRALRREPFDPELDSTHGIQIRTLGLDHPGKQDVIMQLNAWDFGGQEIYHATHQFFLTNRSLFLLAWNARHGFEQGRLYYWLDTIQALAPDSPVLLVATWIDERDPDLPLTELRRRYPQIIGQCAISNKCGTGIEQLRQEIATAAAHLPLMGEKWPATWLDAANAIRERPEKHITPHQMHELMAGHGVKETSAGVLARWMHELGDILYFPDNDELEDTVILKPQWVTEYISKVLVSNEVIDRHGIFTRAHMDELWATLDAGMRDLFLCLMECFDLSYRTLEDRDISLVVERLPFEPPDYAPQWDSIKGGDCNEITMRFRLSTIPAGIPTWFIARSHRFTTGKHWRTGALFGDNRDGGQHFALAQAFPNERYLELSVRGLVPQNFFALLRDGIEVTLARFPGLEIKRMIPCPGHNGEPCAHEFDYEDLLKRINKKPVIECPKSLEDVSVSDLLFGIDWSTKNAVLSAIEQSKDEVLAAVQVARAAGAEEYKQTINKIDELTTLTQRAFTSSFNHQQRLTESHCPNVFVLRSRNLKGWQRIWRLVRKPSAGQALALQLYCQQPGQWHPALDGGLYEIDEPAEWFVKVAPVLRGIAGVFKVVAPLTGPTAAWTALFIGPAAAQAVQYYNVDIEFTKALVEKLPESKDDATPDLVERVGEHDDPDRAQGAALRALRQLLDAKDPQQHWGGLRKILTPEGHYLWLCEHHAAEYLR